jgi:hypothetical protein
VADNHGRRAVLGGSNLRDCTAKKFVVSGIVYSGTYTIDDATRYTVRKGISQTYFQCSKLSLTPRFPDGNPEDQMKGKTIIARGKRYTVNDVYGLDGGMLTFLLKPSKETA